MDDGDGLPVNGFAHLLSGKPVTATLPPAITAGRWLEANATAGQVAVSPRRPRARAPGHRADGPHAGSARPAEPPPRWRVLRAGAPLPAGFAPAFTAGPLSVAARHKTAYRDRSESSFPLWAVRCDTGGNVASPHRTARRARRDLGRLLPADQVRAGGLQRPDDRLGAHGDRGARAGRRPARAPSRGALADMRRRPGWAAAARLRLGGPAVQPDHLRRARGAVRPDRRADLAGGAVRRAVRAVHRPVRADRPPPGASACSSAWPASRSWSASSRSRTLEQFLGALAMVGAAACYALGGFVVKRRYGRPDLDADVVRLDLRRLAVDAAGRGRHGADRDARRSAPSPPWSRSASSAPRSPS